jgi:hypothetical protein
MAEPIFLTTTPGHGIGRIVQTFVILCAWQSFCAALELPVNGESGLILMFLLCFTAFQIGPFPGGPRLDMHALPWLSRPFP